MAGVDAHVQGDDATQRDREHAHVKGDAHEYEEDGRHQDRALERHFSQQTGHEGRIRRPQDGLPGNLLALGLVPRLVIADEHGRHRETFTSPTRKIRRARRRETSPGDGARHSARADNPIVTAGRTKKDIAQRQLQRYNYQTPQNYK